MLHHPAQRRHALLFAFLCVMLAAAPIGTPSAAQATPCTPLPPASGTIPDPVGFKRPADLPPPAASAGTFGGEIMASTLPRAPQDPSCLPNRPFIGTELYFLSNDAGGDQERAWLAELNLDFLRVEVSPEEIEPRNDDGDPFTDFTNWTARDFSHEGGRGWNFENPDTLLTNVMQNLGVVRFPLMMMMHYGGESFMGNPPNSDEYAEYFLATVYYYNVVRGLNIKYWEVLNEPDWGYDDVPLSAADYAEIFRKVAERVKAHPDPRIHSIRLGGPVMGSGDPIDGEWPDGFANAEDDGERDWRAYIPTLLREGSRPGHFDVGFISWHDYGSDTWGLPNNVYNLENTYQLANRVNAIYALADDYVAAGGQRPTLVVSEMNLAAGKTLTKSKERYKNFYAALWHTSALNNYLSTGRLALVSHFYWKGKNDWPKGLVYQDEDSGGQLVRNPVWWAYREYIRHTAEKVVAAQNGRIDQWTDSVATTNAAGNVLYIIAVNKSAEPRPVELVINAPDAISGEVRVSKRTMIAGGAGEFGAPFAEPVITDVYTEQPVTLAPATQVRYAEMLPPRTVVYYTIVKR